MAWNNIVNEKKGWHKIWQGASTMVQTGSERGKPEAPRSPYDTNILFIFFLRAPSMMFESTNNAGEMTVLLFLDTLGVFLGIGNSSICC